MSASSFFCLCRSFSLSSATLRSNCKLLITCDTTSALLSSLRLAGCSFGRAVLHISHALSESFSLTKVHFSQTHTIWFSRSFDESWLEIQNDQRVPHATDTHSPVPSLRVIRRKKGSSFFLRFSYFF